MNAAQPTSQLHQHRVRQGLVDTRFIKISGPTGDWVVFHEPTKDLVFTLEQIVWLCDRSTGVGAAGVVVITPTQPSTQYAVFHLESWLADGTQAENLTEAARAGTYALAALKKISSTETSHHVFHTTAGIVTTVYTPSYVGVDIGQWSYTAPEIATAAGSDTLVMAAGLTDPRPGVSVRIHTPHVIIAVETLDELDGIDLTHRPSLEPAPTEPTSLNFVVPQDPLMLDGMGQIAMRHYPAENETYDLGSAAAAATVAFQTWAGLTQLNIWNVSTPSGDIVVQLHEDQRLSTFVTLSTVFFGRL